MHVDRTAVQSPASAPASLAVRAHGGGRPALPGIPGPLDALLRPQKEEFRFTETSYYAIEHWEPMPMDAAQATAHTSSCGRSKRRWRPPRRAGC